MVSDQSIKKKLESNASSLSRGIDHWYVYIARCSDESLYVGSSSNVAERIKTHNKGLGAHWIRQHGEAFIVYTELYDSYLKTIQRERQIKRWSRIKKENLIQYGKPIR